MSFFGLYPKIFVQAGFGTVKKPETHTDPAFKSFYSNKLPGHVNRPLFPYNRNFYLAGEGHFRLYFLCYFKT
jgi:hypothetical protein